MNNLAAFLTAIAVSEGTAAIGDRGYNVLVGATPAQPLLFGSYHSHPHTMIQLRPGLVSDAAGRYQILGRYFTFYRASLSLPDFSPASQDAIATQMIREVGAMADIEAGAFSVALSKAASRWASLPGAGYGQHENTMAMLQNAYVTAGGVLA